MFLLDLPPEVFARIITHAVTGEGIVEAWKHRPVCRTFRRAIEFESLANQPTRAFLRTGPLSARGILRSNMALYLSYRMRAEKQAYSFVPRFLNTVLDVVCLGLTDKSYDTRNKYARTLCNLIVKEKFDLLRILLTIKAPETSQSRSLVKARFSAASFSAANVETNVAVAAAVGNLNALRTALGVDAEQIWVHSEIFGYPLAAAAAGGHIEVVGAILKHFEQNPLSISWFDREPAFRLAIKRSLQNSRLEVASLLLQIWNAYARPLDRDAWGEWMGHAINTRNKDVIRQVRKVRQAASLDATAAFEKACQVDDIAAVRMFVDEGLVSIYYNSWYATTLQMVVDLRSAKAAKLLLDMGADPNYEASECLPLWTAILNMDQDNVDLLLDHGANPTLGEDLWEASSEEFQDARSKIHRSLLAAKSRGKYHVGPITPMTRFAADAPDLVLSVQADSRALEEDACTRQSGKVEQPSRLNSRI